MKNSLKKAIRKSISATIKDWNKTRLKNFPKVFVLPYHKFFQGIKTQEITKIISPILTQIFYSKMRKRLSGFIVNYEDGWNFKYDQVPYELNITLATGNSWTGNGYDKEPNHLLLRFSIDENGKIYKKFAMMVDLDQCKSSWTVQKKKINFSTLQILTKDSKKISLINGEIKRNPKYLGLIMEEV